MQNYFLVDGVSANLGNGTVSPAQGGAGQLPATSAFGGTSNLVSLDALEEFRIQTSTFAPEYGRTPGAQISVVTKSGTNSFHGTAFEYWRQRDTGCERLVRGANWKVWKKRRTQAKLDFGGVLGGPIIKDKLFFFGSYEGLRVRQPLIANTYVPTLATLASASAGVQPLLNAFPKPTPGGKDFGNGTAAFTASYSDPSSLDSSSIRIDYLPLQKVTVFGRYSDSPSSVAQRAAGVEQRAYSEILHTKNRFQSLTLGSNQLITTRLTNEFRFNYSRSRGENFDTLDNFGGAVPPPDSVLFPSFASSNTASFSFFGDFNPFGLNYDKGKLANNLQHQINVTDNVSRVIGTHQLKFGLDYRRLRPEAGLLAYDVQYVFGSLAAIVANTVPEAFRHSVEDGRCAIGNFQLEPLRPGHMESHAQLDDHLWRSVGVQCCALVAQRHSAIYGDGLE